MKYFEKDKDLSITFRYQIIDFDWPIFFIQGVTLIDDKIYKFVCTMQ